MRICDKIENMKIKKVNIRLSVDEIEMLKRQAAKKGLTVSAYVRMLIYEKEPGRPGSL